MTTGGGWSSHRPVMRVIEDRLCLSLGVVLAQDPAAPGEQWWEVDPSNSSDPTRWRPLSASDPKVLEAVRARAALDAVPKLRAEVAEVLRQNEERYRLDIERFTSEVAGLRRELAERSEQLEELLERIPADPPLRHEEALARAADWAEGRLSHNNALLTAERSPDDRVATLALIAFADAQEVVKWSALAMALREQDTCC